MAPIAALWAELMSRQGHDVLVVTAFPHYPPIWGQKWLPRRERRGPVHVLRLPLVIGHASTSRRVLEEVTYAASAGVAAATTRRPEVAVVVSPSFLALQPVLGLMRLRGVPTILWLQDILPDAAETTGLLHNPLALAAARRLERTAYCMADRIVAISETFRLNLIEKGVPSTKIAVVYNPATRGFTRQRRHAAEPRILSMGNIGLSQGLAVHVRAFEASDLRARLVIVGTGEAAEAVRAAARSRRVEMRGLVDDVGLEAELDRAALGLITQKQDVSEFNVPSRLMTLMARGIPIVASVRPTSEVARIVERSGGGWVTTLSEFVDTLAKALADPGELDRRGEAARRFAEEWFLPEAMTARFDELLRALVGRRPETSRGSPGQ
jgi:colanic acid biosynthesis glycosyl transferase WcaI